MSRLPDPKHPKPTDALRDEDRPVMSETDAPEEDFVEGQLPGLPVSNDPLGNPLPTPARREIPPLD